MKTEGLRTPESCRLLQPCSRLPLSWNSCWLRVSASKGTGSSGRGLGGAASQLLLAPATPYKGLCQASTRDSWSAHACVHAQPVGAHAHVRSAWLLCPPAHTAMRQIFTHEVCYQDRLTLRASEHWHRAEVQDSPFQDYTCASSQWQCSSCSSFPRPL